MEPTNRPQATLTRYRFRAECQRDVNELCRLLNTQPHAITTELTAGFPDVEAAIVIVLSLEQLRDVMRQVEDGHVMVQTVAPTQDYTGKRNYDL
jgi:hypothetical protein